MIELRQEDDPPLSCGKGIRDTGNSNHDSAFNVHRLCIWNGASSPALNLIGIASLISCGKPKPISLDA